MKKKLIFIVLTILLITSLTTMAQEKKAADRMLRHVVLFKFKDTAKPEEVKRIETAFRALSGKINLIKGFEWGTNISPENLNQGLTHCFFVTFTSEKDRDDYLIHPAHQAFVELLKPSLDKATVVDYWASR